MHRVSQVGWKLRRLATMNEVAVLQNGLLEEFMEWAAAEQAAGNITFAVKLAEQAATGAGGARQRRAASLRSAMS